MTHKATILAGRSATRLHPTTQALSKQLLPGIRQVLTITTPVEQPTFGWVFGDGSAWGMRIAYAVQPSPDGVAQAFLIRAQCLAGSPAAPVLGGNLLNGQDLRPQLAASNGYGRGNRFYSYPVRDPERYCVVGVL